MDNIALLWIALAVLFLIIVFKPGRSGYAGFVAPNSLIDLQEFRRLPGDLKQAYRDVVLNSLVPQMSQIITDKWNALSDDERKKIITQLKTNSDNLVKGAAQTPAPFHPPTSPLQQALQCATDPVAASQWAQSVGITVVPSGTKCPIGTDSVPGNFNGFTVCAPQSTVFPQSITNMLGNCR
jgi:hypothetical protein